MSTIPKHPKFTRNDLKKTSMLAGYNAGRKLLTKQFQDDYDGKFADIYMDLFYKAQDIVSPAAGQLKDLVNSIWNDKWTEVKWTMPDGFVVSYRPTETVEINITPFGVPISCLAVVNKNTSRGSALVVNIIHSVDGYIARQMKLKMKALGHDSYSIHDGFHAHMNFTADKKLCYKEILSEILESRLLEDILGQITNTKIPSITKGFTRADIMSGEYAIS